MTFDQLPTEWQTHIKKLQSANKSLRESKALTDGPRPERLPASWVKELADLRKENAKFRIERNEARAELAALRAELAAK